MHHTAPIIHQSHRKEGDELPTKPFARQTLSAQVYEHLREEIVFMQRKPGEMISENEIAEQLQVSRTPIREALRLLANERLIEIIPQVGSRVSLISVRKIEEAWFIREQLEVGAFVRAARMWDLFLARQYEEPLLQLIEQQRDAAFAGEHEKLLKLDEEFHKTIISITKNETLIDVIEQMRAHVNRARLLTLKEKTKSGLVVAEHEDILQAIKKRDAQQTGALLENHLQWLHLELPELQKQYPDWFTD